MESESKCPALGGPHRHTAVGTMSNQHWWPNQLNLKILHQGVATLSAPPGRETRTVNFCRKQGNINVA